MRNLFLTNLVGLTTLENDSSARAQQNESARKTSDVVTTLKSGGSNSSRLNRTLDNSHMDRRPTGTKCSFIERDVIYGYGVKRVMRSRKNSFFQQFVV